ncbi:MAG: glycosyltransferase [Bacteroidota bacterium]
MIQLFINSMTSGGAEKVVLTLLEQFQQAEQSVELCCIEREQFYDIPKDIPVHYLSEHESLAHSWWKIPHLFICAWKLKQWTDAHQVPIVQSHLLRATFINAIAKRMGARYRAQVVLHSRINFDHRPWWHRQMAKWLYRKALQEADSVVSICQSMKLELDEYLQLKDHPDHQAIYNPHPLDSIRQKAAAQIGSFSFQSNTDYIVSVGRLVKGKRLDDLLRAFHHLRGSNPRDIALLIIGEGDQQETLEALADELGIRENVHFLGYQQNPFAYIARSQVLVLSSEWEGLPNVLIEALACETAVISSDCISGPREILHPQSDLQKQLVDEWEKGPYGWLYPVGRWELLADCLAQLLADSSSRQALEINGVKRAQDFAAERIAQQYLSSLGIPSSRKTSV